MSEKKVKLIRKMARNFPSLPVKLLLKIYKSLPWTHKTRAGDKQFWMERIYGINKKVVTNA